MRVSLTLATAQTTGGAGKDKLLNAENLIGSNFNDTLTGNAGVNELRDGQGNDTLNGSGGADSLIGEEGNDILNFDELDTTVSGGAGTDTATVTGVHAAVFLNLTDNQIESASSTTSIYDNILVAPGATWAVTITGGSGNDYILGGDMNDRLTGGSGDDSLYGGLGNDSLTGGLGSERLYGAEDNDSLTIDSDDFGKISGDAGIDSVTVNATSGAVILNLVAALVERVLASTSTANKTFNATGATWAVSITGGTGNDTIIGGNLNDTLTGGQVTTASSVAAVTTSSREAWELIRWMGELTTTHSRSMATIRLSWAGRESIR